MEYAVRRAGCNQWHLGRRLRGENQFDWQAAEDDEHVRETRFYDGKRALAAMYRQLPQRERITAFQAERR